MRGNIKNTLTNLKKKQVTRQPLASKNLTTSTIAKGTSFSANRSLSTQANRINPSIKPQVNNNNSFNAPVPSYSNSKMPKNQQQKVSSPTNSSNGLSASARSFTSAVPQMQKKKMHSPSFNSPASFQTPYANYATDYSYSYAYDPNQQVMYYTPVITYYPVYYPPYVQDANAQPMYSTDQFEGAVINNETAEPAVQSEENYMTEESAATSAPASQPETALDPRAYATTPVYSRKPSAKPNFHAFTQSRISQNKANPFATSKRNFSSLQMKAEEDEELDEMSEITSEVSSTADSLNKVTLDDLFVMIQQQIKTHSNVKVSWLNRLLTKVQTTEDWHKAFFVVKQFIDQSLATTTETGTLFIKAACRAGAAEQALKSLKDVQDFRLFPTLGGIHYLMINFSLQKGQTANVISAFGLCEARDITPTTRTYHILIRECVDNGLLDDAMVFAKASTDRQIAPSRVAFNILMNGCRQAGKYEQILEYRDQMKKFNLEINDTTVKFTVVAHLMMGNFDAAFKEFKSYPDLDTKLSSFCSRFLELLPDHEAELTQLFTKLEESGLKLPQNVHEKLSLGNDTASSGAEEPNSEDPVDQPADLEKD